MSTAEQSQTPTERMAKLKASYAVYEFDPLGSEGPSEDNDWQDEEGSPEEDFRSYEDEHDPDGPTHAAEQPRVRVVRDGERATASGGVKESLPISSAADMTSWLEYNLGTGPLSGMFRRERNIVLCPQIGPDGYIPPVNADDGPGGVYLVDKSQLASRIQVIYRCYRVRKDDNGKKREVPAMFPPAAARVAADAPDLMPKLRRLRSILHTPTVRPDGSILATPGYDAATSMLYLPTPGLVVPAVPDRPSDVDVAQARMLIEHMLCDYKFRTEHDRANYIGMLLTPLLRTIVPGPYKLGIIQAPQRGSGKTFLAEALHTLYSGETHSEMPNVEEELRKQITAFMMSSNAVYLWDNVKRKINSSTIEMLLTTKVWSDRILGASSGIAVPNDRFFTVTGNNVKIAGDMARRALWSTIDPKCAKPENRTGFKIADWTGWVAENRGLILWALLVMVRAWAVNGAQLAEPRSSDGYARWSRTVRAILATAGFEGEFEHPDTVVAELSEDEVDWANFYEHVYQHFGDKPWTVKQVLDITHDARLPVESEEYNTWKARHPIPLDALPAGMDEDAVRLRTGFGTIPRRLGSLLAKREGTFCGQYAARKASDRGRSGVTWRLEAEGGDSA